MLHRTQKILNHCLCNKSIRHTWVRETLENNNVVHFHGFDNYSSNAKKCSFAKKIKKTLKIFWKH